MDILDSFIMSLCHHWNPLQLLVAVLQEVKVRYSKVMISRESSIKTIEIRMKC